jgi:hypothetical protein
MIRIIKGSVPILLFILGIICVQTKSASCPVTTALTPGEANFDILNQFQYTFCGTTVITEAEVPLIITAPGNYKLAQDIIASSTIITIAANDVVLDLGAYTITQTDTTGAAAIVIGGNNITIQNGALIALTPPIFLITNNAPVSGLVCQNLSFVGPTGTLTGGINLNPVTFFPLENIVIQECSFAIDTGIGLGAPYDAVAIDNCYFANCASYAISFTTGSGIGSRISGTNLLIDGGGTGIFVGGSSIENAVFQNITIQNPGQTVQSNNLLSPNTGLFLNNVSNGILDNVSIISTGTTPVATDGIACDASFNITIKNASVTNTTGVGILINSSSNAIVKDSTTESTGDIGISCVGSSYVTIKNCIVDFGFSDGITLDITTTSCIIQECTVNGCAGTGINMLGGSSNNALANLATNNGINFAGIPAELIANSVIAIGTSNYWVNISL